MFLNQTRTCHEYFDATVLLWRPKTIQCSSEMHIFDLFCLAANQDAKLPQKDAHIVTLSSVTDVQRSSTVLQVKLAHPSQ
jgi:hypothetical protein